MGATGRPGLSALAEVAGLDPAATALKPGQVAFALAPRLNAAGRMEEATVAVRLLLTADPAEGAALAAQLDGANRRRQVVEGGMLEEAVALVEAAWAEGGARTAIVLASPDWHPGVLGIVASRLVERFRVPAALAAILGEEVRGSIRSPGGWHVADSLRQCADLLEHFGGHEAAGGFSLPVRNLEAFRDRLLGMASTSAAATGDRPPLVADAEVELSTLDLGLADALARLAPHGMGNPEPVLVARALQVMRSPRRVGRNHLKMRVRQPGTAGPVLDSIGFNLGDLVPVLDRPAPPLVDLAFTPERNAWNGRDTLQLRLREVAPCS
jgi:single-stranded-DNA-specific exonuclease